MRRLLPLGLLIGCAHTIAGQQIPRQVLKPDPKDFASDEGVAVLHYYGSGGWGIQWGGSYIVTAPYFSNHVIASLLTQNLSPDVDAIKDGVRGTPFKDAKVILIGHGHIDHAGDVSGFFGDERLESGKPGLVADRSTMNELASLRGNFGCWEAIDFDHTGQATQTCAVPRIRITPIHSAHAPHLKVFGVELADYGGYVKDPQSDLPTRAAGFKLGNTWAYLIDLMDKAGNIVFRIHYMDAAASPPHGLIPRQLLHPSDGPGRDVDLFISCVPGYDIMDDYPEEAIIQHNVRYVMAAHWEDFFQPRTDTLKPVRVVLDDDDMTKFVQRVARLLPEARGVRPLNKPADPCPADKPCGPHGKAWTLPIPGETFRFATGSQAPASPPLPPATAK